MSGRCREAEAAAGRSEKGVFMKSYRIAPGRNVRVAISGKSGCGNTTVSSLLAEALGVRLINFTFRQLAAERGMTLAEVIEAAKTDDSYDIAVDTRQVELARAEPCVLGSRLAVWLLKEADLTVYLKADDDVRARRIQNREGGSLEEIQAFTAMRDSEDARRYKKLYGIDSSDYAFCGLVIDTKDVPPEEIVQRILAELERRGLVERAE